MPLQHVIHLNPHTIIGIWRITEDEPYFQKKINSVVSDLSALGSIHHQSRRVEWLAGRWLIFDLAQRMYLPFEGIWTDEYNKPHLVIDNASISLSHSAPYVVGILDTKNLCGIDIEKIRPKLLPLSTKFLNAEELVNAKGELLNLAILWGAKEALYKLHGMKSLIFKENLSITNFSMDNNFVSFKGSLDIANEHETYEMAAAKFDDYVLVYTSGA